MTAPSDPATSAFVVAFERRGGNPGGLDALAGLLEKAWNDGRTAWPGVKTSRARYAAFLGGRAPTEMPPLDALTRLRLDDLYLASACADLDVPGLATFQARFLSRLPQWLSTLSLDAERVALVRVALRDRLFVGTPEVEPRIREYGGRGTLEGFARVVALRVAMEPVPTSPASPVAEAVDDPFDETFAPGVDPELDLLKARFRDLFAAAFRSAVAELPARARTLLRLQHVERLSPTRIALLYGVHVSTAERWLAAASDEIVVRTRTQLARNLGLDASDRESLLGNVRGRLDQTLDPTRGSPPTRT